MKAIIALLFIFFPGHIVYGQRPILIKAGKLFDSEKKTFLVDQEILVLGNTIKEAGSKLSVPTDAKIVDLSNYTVLPGLIDSHTHLMYLEPIKANLTLENLKMIAMEGDALRVLRAQKRAKTFLDAGITTVKDLGNSGQFLDVALKKATKEGTVDGPRIFASGPILTSVGGQLPGIDKKYERFVSEEFRIIKDAEDARLAVRENITYGADLIKICADNTPNNTSLSIDQMRAIVETAHRYNKKVTAHATGPKAIWEAVISGVDGIEHGYLLADSTAAIMARKKIYLVPTDESVDLLMKYTGKSRDQAEQDLSYARRRLQLATKQGVPIVAGSDQYIDFGIPQGDAAKNVLLAYHESGMTPIDILVSCTKTAADFLGRTGELGVVKKNALADIIAVEGDLEKEFAKTIYQIRFVMVNGRIVIDKK